MENQFVNYDNRIVKYFTFATLFWAGIGLLVGVIIASQLAIPSLNLGISFTSFGRMRPVHTNAVIFAFLGNAIFAGIYYSMQRLLKTRMFSDKLSYFHFWGWQSIIVGVAISLLMGFTTSKEYAEAEFPLDVAITIVWLAFGWNMIGTILIRKVQHLYVAIWFYIATMITVGVLHIFNSLEIPVSFFKSYSVYAGVQDALVQWWYGHNAVAFILTTPFLGLMYYFLPKAAEQPVYSYRLSIMHFWSLIFLYIWTGPHHLLYQALPDWVQSLGIAFSIMLLAPSWGGMVNGFLTLNGAWHKVKENPILKFFVVGITCYGMTTLEGPTLSLKTVNAVAHFTDWTIAHAHVGALGWNGFLTFAMLYWLIPKIFNTQLFSKKLANIHFWVGTIAILTYVIPLYWASLEQSKMWKAFNEEGFLANPIFFSSVLKILPAYYIRIIGGILYLAGFILMFYNFVKTISVGKIFENEKVEISVSQNWKNNENGHKWLESRPVQFVILTLIVILIGGMVQIIPMIVVKSNIPTISSVKPYSPLELEGRDIYIQEGCSNCHSQMIRPFRDETERYGEYSKSGEFVFDHPFLWGSKRTGPDLAREGVISGEIYKPNSWHFNHLIKPTNVVKGSIMPDYPFLAENIVDFSATISKLKAMKKLGVPYSDEFIEKSKEDMEKQAGKLVENLKNSGINVEKNTEIVALIAYLQRLGTDIFVKTDSVSVKK